MTLGIRGAELMVLTLTGGMVLVPVGGTVMTLRQFIRAFQLVAGAVTSQNLLFQVEEVTMFCTSGKEMGAPTGSWLYDSARELTEMASTQFAVYGLMNPRTYQRPKITPLPDETGLTVPGGTGVAVVPNGTAPAVKPPYLPGQYPEYPAAVQGWAQQALPGGGRGIGGGTDVGNIAKKLDTNNIPNMTKQDIIDSIPDDWNYTEHNGFVHIRDADGNIRIRIDPPDKVTNYPHVHAYDSDGNLLDSAGNIVDRKSPDGHMPYKDN